MKANDPFTQTLVAAGIILAHSLDNRSSGARNGRNFHGFDQAKRARNKARRQAIRQARKHGR